jgi:hypothetical protein
MILDVVEFYNIHSKFYENPLQTLRTAVMLKYQFSYAIHAVKS